MLERRLKREQRSLARLEDLREKNDRFLHQTICDLTEIESLLRQRHEALEAANAELRIAQERLVASERTANEANKAKSSFLANMSHELRTPLTAIIGYSEFLIEEGLSDRVEALDDLGRVLLSARHLLSLVNDVLDVSKIEAGHYDVALETFDLTDLIDEMLAASQVLIGNNKNNLLWTKGPEILVFSDAKALRQCLFNLVSNSAKFTESGTIEVSCEQVTDHHVVVTVSDTGIGMRADQLASIFEQFTQAKPQIGKKYGGTGLGLSITRRLLAMLNGIIDVSSAEGVGSTFTVTLPLRFDETTHVTTRMARRRRSSGA